MSDAAPVEVVVEPFDFPALPGVGPSDAPTAVALCLHGLTGTPYEVRPLGEALAASGIAAIGPALPGHNETPEALAQVSHTDWLDAADTHYLALRERYARVFVVGLSMGGLLALSLASRHPVDAVVVVGTPLVLRQRFAWMIPLLKHVQPLSPKRGGSDLRDAAARDRHPSYPVMPLNSVHELQRLQRVVRDRLNQITSPIFVAHGAHDRTAHPDDAIALVGSVASEVCEHFVYESSGHVVPVDYDGAELAAQTAEFLVRHR